MSKRYGRNQRRAHRAQIDFLNKAIVSEHSRAIKEIAKRDDAIAALRAGDWYRADGKNANLADMISHITAHEITEGVDTRGRRFRKADITAHCDNSQMHALHDRNWHHGRNGYVSSFRPSLVEWNGATWYLKEVQVPRSYDYGEDRYFERDALVCTIILEGIAPPASQKVSPLMYLFGRDREVETPVRAIDGTRFHRADNRPVMRIE